LVVGWEAALVFVVREETAFLLWKEPAFILREKTTFIVRQKPPLLIIRQEPPSCSILSIISSSLPICIR